MNNRKNILKLYFAVMKNLKILFRNWTSILMIIFGPLALILIIGFAFNSSSLHDVRIGIYSLEKVDFISSLKGLDYIQLIDYGSEESCKKAIARNELVSCMIFDKKQNPSDQQNVRIIIDNSQKVSIYLIPNLKDVLSSTSDQMSEQMTSVILTDIESAQDFMVSSQASLSQMQNELENTKKELYDIKNQLTEIQSSFTPRYKKIKDAQTKINEKDDIRIAESKINSASDELISALNTADQTIVSAQSNIDNLINSAGYSLLDSQTKNSISSVSSAFSSVDSLMESLRNQIYSSKNTISSSANDLQQLKQDFNAIVEDLDKIDGFLKETIPLIDSKISAIDVQEKKLSDMSNALSGNIAKFSGLDNSKSKVVSNPIKVSFFSFFDNLANSSFMFPAILAVIILFVSMLLSNIIVLDEIHSQAYFRNFITPVHPLIFILGLLITNLIVSFFQISLFLVIAQVNLKINILSNLAPLLISIFLVSLFFSMIGMILAYAVSSQQTSILVATFTGLGFFLSSDIILPLEVMPSAASFVARLNPVVLGESIFRQAIFFNATVPDLLPLFILLVFPLAGTFLLLMLAEKKNRKSF